MIFVRKHIHSELSVRQLMQSSVALGYNKELKGTIHLVFLFSDPGVQHLFPKPRIFCIFHTSIATSSIWDLHGTDFFDQTPISLACRTQKKGLQVWQQIIAY